MFHATGARQRFKCFPISHLHVHVVLKSRILQYIVLSHRHRVDPVGLLVEGRIIPEKPVVQAVSIKYIIMFYGLLTKGEVKMAG